MSKSVFQYVSGIELEDKNKTKQKGWGLDSPGYNV